MLPYELSARTTMDITGEGARVVLLIPATAGGAIWQAATVETK